jgi:hypothetical protein
MWDEEDIEEEFIDTGILTKPYTDKDTGNLILQEMDLRDTEERIQNNRSQIGKDLDELVGRDEVERGYISDAESEELSRQVKTVIEEKGPAFRYTPEFFKVIEDEKVRKEAYRSIVLTEVPNEEEKDIERQPFKYLGLPDDSTFGQVRAAYITLTRLYHPDIVDPQNVKQRHLIFGTKPFSPDPEKSLSEWLKSIEKSEPPETMSVEELEDLDKTQREDYLKKKEAYRYLEVKYESVREEMRLRATKKMQIVTKAYTAAKKFFSNTATSGLGGFEWERVVEKSDYMPDDFDGFQHERVGLEGDGEIRKNVGKFNSDQSVYLVYDFGEVYMGGADYMQGISLKQFFAWTELRQERELSPLLLDDIVKQYKLDPDRAEQLRVMMMGRESPDFIVDALEIPEPKKYEGNELRWFIESALLGPQFSHQVTPRGYESYDLGVEMKNDGGMILQFTTQGSQHNWWGSGKTKQSAHFTREDLGMMTVLAYGPLLTQMNDL